MVWEGSEGRSKGVEEGEEEVLAGKAWGGQWDILFLKHSLTVSALCLSFTSEVKPNQRLIGHQTSFCLASMMF